ncbi:probable pectinesterase 67 [Coffea arabica]|uniref:Pectinesterase n=1 Tax=Coffea arabica TaxID=13443 RepID=A0A6P6WS31_COFAR|nr:probable pectinesterase 67 [Coffea arabica]
MPSSSSTLPWAKNVAYVHFLVMSVLISDVVHCSSDRNVIDSNLLTQKIGTRRATIVDISGQGDFRTIQAAIDAVPEGNSNWTIIHVRKGVYREKVHIPRNKPFIFLRGNGKGKTSIVWSQSSVDNYQSAAFLVESQNFVAFGISFKNEAPTGIAYTSRNQSVAAFVGADKVAFYHCAFFSSHNTLFDYKGRHYYDNCYIQGSIDFIFGRGQSMFHNCEIFVIGDKRAEIHGSITAHSRRSAGENSGFVFVGGKIYGVGSLYLGRANAPFSRVVFANTYFSRTIVPQGWTNWSYAGSPDRVYLAEYKCHGPGSASKDRAKWSKQLDDKEVAPFLSIDYINGKQWLPAWL